MAAKNSSGGDRTRRSRHSRARHPQLDSVASDPKATTSATAGCPPASHPIQSHRISFDRLPRRFLPPTAHSPQEDLDAIRRAAPHHPGATACRPARPHTDWTVETHLREKYAADRKSVV